MRTISFSGGFKRSVKVALIGRDETVVLQSWDCTWEGDKPSQEVTVELRDGFVSALVDGRRVSVPPFVETVVVEHYHGGNGAWTSYEVWDWDGRGWRHDALSEDDGLVALLRAGSGPWGRGTLFLFKDEEDIRRKLADMVKNVGMPTLIRVWAEIAPGLIDN